MTNLVWGFPKQPLRGLAGSSHGRIWRPFAHQVRFLYAMHERVWHRLKDAYSFAERRYQAAVTPKSRKTASCIRPVSAILSLAGDNQGD
jgi:hypothetical protein